MWPLLLDMTKEESMQSLRCLELEAYAGLVTALRAQGPLSSEKLKLLKETGSALNISQDRHKAEVRRAVNDEKLNTIAYHVSGQKLSCDEWAQEGRRLIPLMPRIAPQTAYAAIADEAADATHKNNKQLPSPSSTERKRTASMSSQISISDNKSMPFRIPEPPKCDDIKKRKLPIPVENSSLAQHLMGPPKISRIQQIYRQKTKARQKEQLQLVKVKQEQEKQDVIQMQQKVFQQQIQQKLQQKLPVTQQNSQSTSPKVNIIQNISVQSSEEENEYKSDASASIVPRSIDVNHFSPQPGCSSENQAPKTKPMIAGTKLNQHITLKHMTSLPGPSGEKQIKVCAPRKTITTKSIAGGQKLIVVSNPQTITTSSILQRTLTIPFVKNISVKNFDKFKIVTTNNTSNIQLSPLTTASPFNPSSKHKVVTVRTNPGVKKVIPLSQLQVLNAKGGIKVLPIGGKIVSKSNISTGSAPVYIVNSSSMQCLTKSTTSTPIIMTCKTQETNENKSLLFLKSPEISIASNAADTVMHALEVTHVNTPPPLVTISEDAGKSSVLAEIMEAVGVVPSDSETYTDIENEITQHTIQNNSDSIEHTSVIDQSGVVRTAGPTDQENEALIQTLEPEDIVEVAARSNDTYYIVEERKPSKDAIGAVLKQEPENVSGIGNLDPTTGLYSVTPSMELEFKEAEDKRYIESAVATDMPNINPND